MATKSTKLWIWNWKEGGYNCANAQTKAEAVKKAEEMAKGTVLHINPATLHVGTEKELAELDRHYAGMFD